MKRHIIKALLKGGVGKLGREVTKDKILAAISQSGKSGLVGGVLDGFLGSAEAVKLYRHNYINRKTAAKHAANETACGFFTATAGTLGTSVATLALGSMGPTALVVGMGASVGARWVYRMNTENPLPDLEEEPPMAQEQEQDLNELLDKMRAIGITVEDDEDRD